MKISILSLNVRGLRNQVKRRTIFRFLKDQNCQIYLLQKTFPEQKDEPIWKSEWGGATGQPSWKSEYGRVSGEVPTGQPIAKEFLF